MYVDLEKVYFLFDEIQEVSEWQKLINGLRIAFDSDIYVTGSNAITSLERWPLT